MLDRLERVFHELRVTEQDAPGLRISLLYWISGHATLHGDTEMATAANDEIARIQTQRAAEAAARTADAGTKPPTGKE